MAGSSKRRKWIASDACTSGTIAGLERCICGVLCGLLTFGARRRPRNVEWDGDGRHVDWYLLHLPHSCLEACALLLRTERHKLGRTGDSCCKSDGPTPASIIAKHYSRHSAPHIPQLFSPRLCLQASGSFEFLTRLYKRSTLLLYSEKEEWHPAMK